MIALLSRIFIKNAKDTENPEVRRKYGVNILSVHREGRYLVAPAPDMPFHTGDTLLVMGRREDVEKLRK